MRNCTRSIRDVTLAAFGAALLCALGCGGGRTPVMPNTYAYIEVAAPASDVSSIAQFQVTNAGTLTPLTPATVPAGSNISGLSVGANSNYLYALNDSGYAVPSAFLRFSINSAGLLASNPLASPSAGTTPYPFALTHDGRFALIPAMPNGPGTLSSYSVSSAGALTLVNTVSAGVNPCIVVIDATGKLAYVADFVGSAILEYKIAADGTLTPNGTISTGIHNQPYFLALSPQGFLYSAGCCQLQAVSEYAINSSTGKLTHLNDFPAFHDQSSVPVAIAFDVTGTYAYVTNTDGAISGYTIASFKVNKTTGALTRNGPDTPSAGALQLAVDPSGKFVFALSATTVYQFKIGSSGTLVPNGTATLPGSVPRETSGVIAFSQH